MVIPKAIVEEMLAHLRVAYRNGFSLETTEEGCGLLAGQNDVIIKHYPTDNIEPENKHIRYLIDPKQQIAAEAEIDENGWELTAIYHSHTFTAAYPSPTDIRTAYYPDSYYIIVSFKEFDKPDIRAYKIIKTDPWGDTGEVIEYPITIKE